MFSLPTVATISLPEAEAAAEAAGAAPEEEGQAGQAAGAGQLVEGCAQACRSRAMAGRASLAKVRELIGFSWDRLDNGGEMGGPAGHRARYAGRYPKPTGGLERTRAERSSAVELAPGPR